MRSYFLMFLCVMALTLNLACAEKANQTNVTEVEKKSNQPEKLVHVEVDIEGMTCEIGCARLIESKLIKTQGVNYANVSFELKKGEFTYDSNTISEKDLITNIEKIAGGELYRVVKISEVDAFSDSDPVKK